MDIFLQYILPSIISVVGAVAAAIVTIYTCCKTIKSGFKSQQIQLQLNIEEHAQSLKIEREMKIYGDLSCAALALIQSCSNLFSYGLVKVPMDETARKNMEKAFWRDASEKYDAFVKTLYDNALFVSNDLVEYLEEKLNTCKYLITMYDPLILNYNSMFEADYQPLIKECREKNRNLESDLKDIQNVLRANYEHCIEHKE